MVKLWKVAALALAAGLGGGATLSWSLAAQVGGGPLGPLALDGADWDRMSSDMRAGYLAGFIAGAAAHQATRGRPEVTGQRAAAEAARLKLADALHFPYGENVYRSHLDDYYFYRNLRKQTLIQVLVDLNGRMRRGT